MPMRAATVVHHHHIRLLDRNDRSHCLAGLVLCFNACFILLVIAPLRCFYVHSLPYINVERKMPAWRPVRPNT